MSDLVGNPDCREHSGVVVERRTPEWRAAGFYPHRRHRVVSLSKTHLLPTVLVKCRKSWLPPDMTEKLLTGTLSLNTNK